ncbi:hypothetical protein vseg_007713 [Gypsophila vaccaria]
MEDPIPYDVVGLPTPPLDDDFALFPELNDVTAGEFDVNFDFGVDFDLDFSVDDIAFADELLLQLPDPNYNPVGVGSGEVSPNSNDFDNNLSNENVVRVCDSASSETNRGISSSKDSNSKSNDVSSDDFDVNNNNNYYNNDDNYNNCDNYYINDVVSGVNFDLRPKTMNDQRAKSSSNRNSLTNSRSDNGSGGSGGSGGGGGGSEAVSKTKRKKEVENDHAVENRSNKFRRSSLNANVNVKTKANVSSDENVEGEGDEDEKRKARLMRNRESAHLSRQRKKQYVEELEEKVKSMVSTIADLNGKISYFMTENASLRQQLSGGVAGPGMVPPGMYPMAPMPYTWMPCPPPGYMVNSRGSNVPLVPIPRLKPQQPAPAPKVKKSLGGKSEKKGEGKTKKVASVSLLGLLFFMLLFGGLLPMVSVRYGRGGDGFGAVQKGAVFKFDRRVETNGYGDGRFGHGRALQQVNSSNGNASEPLVASLYVPRNDKMVKIDGNLIIHSILASEKALASKTVEGLKTSEETGLVVHGSHPPYPTPGPGSNDWRHPHLDRNHNGRPKALGSGSTDFTPIGTDGRLQQWFREGLAGPMLSSGMCTEVFQFEVSPTPISVVPATSMVNITSEDRLNYTRPNQTKNRRILPGHALPLKDNTPNTTGEPVQPHERSDGLQSNKTRSSVVVSVLVDPREVGDGDGEGVLGSKTISRIFVVVLIDSVKYVTYSCMLPFMGSNSHLITS